MEEHKQLALKLIFVVPGLVACITGVYSFFYLSDIISKLVCIHLM